VKTQGEPGGPHEVDRGRRRKGREEKAEGKKIFLEISP
jgi:hypothetical protein